MQAEVRPNMPLRKTTRRSMSRELIVMSYLDLLEHTLLELPLNLLTILVCRRLAVQCQETTQVELGRLEELDLANVDLKPSC